MFINNVILRPLELENLCCYEMISEYELKREKIKNLDEDDENNNVESKTTFNLTQEHPSHQHIVMSKRRKIVIPSITNTYLIPNIKDLELYN